MRNPFRYFNSSPEGETGVRTLGTLARTTVFEIDGRSVSECLAVPNRVDKCGFSNKAVPVGAETYRLVMRSSFANWFA